MRISDWSSDVCSSDLAPITSLGNASGPNGVGAGSATDYETFLRLLTAQLRHQDPLSPADPTQFVSQLATFTQVEQSLLTNQQLGDMLSTLRASETTEAMSFMGRTVEAPMDSIRLAGEDVGFAYAVDSAAEKVTMVIKDAKDRKST